MKVKRLQELKLKGDGGPSKEAVSFLDENYAFSLNTSWHHSWGWGWELCHRVIHGQAQQSLKLLECKSLCSGLHALKNEIETTSETSHLKQIPSSSNRQLITNSMYYLLWSKEICIVIIHGAL